METFTHASYNSPMVFHIDNLNGPDKMGFKLVHMFFLLPQPFLFFLSMLLSRDINLLYRHSKFSIFTSLLHLKAELSGLQGSSSLSFCDLVTVLQKLTSTNCWKIKNALMPKQSIESQLIEELNNQKLIYYCSTWFIKW